MIRKFTQAQPANICMRDLYNMRLAYDSRLCLKESRVYTKKRIFKGISGHFQTLVSSGKFQLTQIPFQRRRDEVKQSYRTQDMGPPIQVFFSVTFIKCRHGSVDMRRNHGKVVTGRDVSFWAITEGRGVPRALQKYFNKQKIQKYFKMKKIESNS